MKKKTSNRQLKRALATVSSLVPLASRDDISIQTLGLAFADVADAAKKESSHDVQRAANQFSRLMEIAAAWLERYPDDAKLIDEIVDFVEGSFDLLTAKPGKKLTAEVDEMIELADKEWADYEMILADEVDSYTEPELEFPLDEDFEGLENEDDEIPAANGQIELLLSAISDASPAAVPSDSAELKPDVTDTDSAETPITADRTSSSVEAQIDVETDGDDELSFSESAAANGHGQSDRDAREELQSDREMLEAYLDDSMRCVGAMEKAALTLDSTPDDKESIRAFCRELHTLKGASATVGLASLASHLHELESSLEEVFDADQAGTDAEVLFEAIDFVRREMDSLQPKTVETTDNPQPVALSSGVQTQASPAPDFASFGNNDDSSIRIRASRLDRLMDMLAELVVLRNRRESHASEYDLFHGELSRCASRLSFAEEQSGRSSNSTIIAEVSKDIEVVSSGLRELQKPVANDNASISRFIRDFRQELMQLRRVPVSGLFSRLQRATRDAAKSEQKQVRVDLLGEQAGLEQEIQERLYESLLHVVRNCVSHGIETPEKRRSNGKDETGTVTLEASSSAQLLVIEVRDDGNGVNYEAVRKRGIEKGLLSPNQRATNAELANLIFHPGFSTKETASEISGRGVGMDVVATTLEQLHGRIEVESKTGQGTTIRLLIPLRTGIEHVMVFRSDDQLFALPMQSITAAKSSNTGIENVTRLSLSNTNSGATRTRSESENGDGLVLKRTGLTTDNHQNGQVALAVDELVGPEEVVVRGLPGLLRNHPLFCGITLSGSGEKVLLLESEKVAEYCEQLHSDPTTETTEKTSSIRALVVDDSLTARKFITKILQHNGFTTIEAGDGIEAIEHLHRGNFDLVVTDLDMPRMGGMELLTEIQSGHYCDAPVIVVSSRDDDNFRSKAMDCGACDYITKPVSKKSLQQRLESLGLLSNC